jgi:predicted ATPase
MIERIQRYILAGGPSCGKTTTLEALKEKAMRVVSEAAREVLAEKICANYEEIQREIFSRQIRRENSITKPAFFDRSALEGVAYSLLKLGKVPEPLASYDFRNRYDAIFFLERFPLVQDGIRVETSDEEAEIVHRAIYDAYRKYEYNPITVPRMPVEERVKFILERLH